MLNLTPNSENNLIIYADTIAQNVGNYFLVVFTNSYSRETFAVVPNVVRRNYRFVELSVDLVGVNGQNLPLDGQIYLYPEGNWEYIVFNTDAPTTDPSVPIPCMVWDTDEDFWEFARTVWNVCGLVQTLEIDRGQAFLYSEVPCEREVEFVPYVSDNEFLRNIVYVTGVLPYQFPCTIQAYTTFTVENDTTTYCETITIQNNAILVIDQGITLQQQFSPYEQC